MRVLSIVLFLVSFGLQAAPVKSSISFLAVGNPGFLTIEGKGATLETLTVEHRDGRVIGKAVAILSSLSTDMDLRDKHMHDKYLETKKYPKAYLDFTGNHGVFQGSLTLKGVEKPVRGKYILKGKEVKAIFTVSLAAYPVGVPSWLGVTVAEDVTVTVEASL